MIELTGAAHIHWSITPPATSTAFPGSDYWRSTLQLRQVLLGLDVLFILQEALSVRTGVILGVEFGPRVDAKFTVKRYVY